MADTASERQRVRALLERAGAVVLMTIDEDGRHTGRPMLPLLLEKDPHIYFLTHRSSRKVAQIATRPAVGLTIVSGNCYLVVAGAAYATDNPELIRRLWHPTYRAWFPDGTDDREAIALRVVIARVDYWEPPRSRLIRLAQAVRAVVTRRAVDTPMKTIDGL
jgi:general stress protein 26